MIARPCTCGHVEKCRLCWLYHNNPAYRKIWGPPGLGDRVAQFLSLIGITKSRVEKLMGKPCNCNERQDALNQLGDKLGL